MLPSSGRRCEALALLTYIAISSISVSLGATYRVDFPSVERDAATNEYLLGSFDFGTQFSSIHEVTFELVMTHGLSEAGGSGSSFFSSGLGVSISERPILEPELIAPEHNFNPGGLIAPPTDISLWRGFQGGIRADESVSHSFAGLEQWPEFLFDGKGVVAIRQNDVLSSTGLNSPLGSVTTSSRPAISSAAITINATPVPEPSAVSMAFAAACIVLFAYRKQGHFTVNAAESFAQMQCGITK